MAEFVGAPYTIGSDTSKQTAIDCLDKIKNQREIVWRFIHARGEEGSTFDELVVADILGYTSATRFTELRRLGRIRKTRRTRQTKAGNSAAVHVAIDPKDWSDKRNGWPAPPPTTRRTSSSPKLRKAAKAFEEILARENSPGLFTPSEMADIARRALETLR